MRKLVAIGTLAAMALGAQAAAAAEGISYSLLEGSYVSADGADGFGVHGSFAFNPMIHAFGSWDDMDVDGGGSFGLLNAGLGLNHALNDMWDVYGRASFERIDVGPAESGWGVAGGLRGRVLGSLELQGELKYADIGDYGDRTTITAGGRWYLSPAFAFGADYIVDADDSDLSLWRIAVRYDFGAGM